MFRENYPLLALRAYVSWFQIGSEYGLTIIPLGHSSQFRSFSRERRADSPNYEATARGSKVDRVVGAGSPPVGA
jgi:hypothetical protein